MKPTRIDRVRVEPFDGARGPTEVETDAADPEGRPVKVAVHAGVYELVVFESDDGDVRVAIRQGAGWGQDVPLAVLAKALGVSLI